MVNNMDGKIMTALATNKDIGNERHVENNKESKHENPINLVKRAKR